MGYCILVAGMPASGKTTFANYLGEQLSLPVISKDRIKEILYDTVGFACKQDKIVLGKAGTSLLYYFAETAMVAQKPFIMENNFEEVSKPALVQLLEKYHYRWITMRFGADIRVVYNRFIKRNQSSSRHKGHVLKNVYPEKTNLLLAPMSQEEFVQEIETRGIGNFSIGGAEIVVDTTYFEHVNYEAIVEEVKKMIPAGE